MSEHRGIPAGKVEDGEDHANAILRELCEETGVSACASGLQDLGTLYFRLPQLDFTFHYFELELPKKPAVTLSTREHSAFAWVPTHRVLVFDLMQGGYEAWNIYRKPKASMLPPYR